MKLQGELLKICCTDAHASELVRMYRNGSFESAEKALEFAVISLTKAKNSLEKRLLHMCENCTCHAVELNLASS